MLEKSSGRTCWGQEALAGLLGNRMGEVMERRAKVDIGVGDQVGLDMVE